MLLDLILALILAGGFLLILAAVGCVIDRLDGDHTLSTLWNIAATGLTIAFTMGMLQVFRQKYR